MKDSASSSRFSESSDRSGKVRKGQDTSPSDSEVPLSALIDSAMDGIIVLDARQRIVSFNPAAEAIFRCSAADAIGKSINRFIPRRFRKLHTEYIRAFAREGITQRAVGAVNEPEIAGLRADGEEFPSEISISRFESGGREFFAAIVRDTSEREHVERALRESEARYRTLAEATDDMIWIINRQGQLEYLNEYAATQFEKRPEFLIGKRIDDLFPAEIAKRQKASVKKVMAGGAPFYVEALYPFPGRSIWLGVSLAPMRNDSGEVYAVLGVARDITARKQAEQALQRHDAILEAVSFAAESFLKAADWQENIQEVLAHLGQAAGTSRAYIFENSFDDDQGILSSQRFEWVSPGITPQIGNPDLQNIPLSQVDSGRWLAELAKNQPLYGHTDRASGSQKALLEAQGILSIVIVPVFSGRTFWGFMGYDECINRREWTPMEIQALKTAADILGAAIQRKQAEEVILVSETEYRSLFENALEGIYRTSPEGIILAANPALIKMLGFDSMEDLLLLDFSRELYLRPENRNIVRRAMAEADEQRNVELRLERKDGQPLIVLNNSRTVRDATGQVLYYEGTMVDITDRKHAVEQVNRRVAELEALYESGLALSQSLDPQAIAEEVIEVLSERLNWDHAAVRLRNESGDGVELLAFSGTRTHSLENQLKKTHASMAITRVGQGLSGWVIEHGQAVRSGNLDKDPRYVGAFPEMLSGMYIPMKVGERTIGCISVENPEPDAFTESDERLVTTLGAQAAIAIENARLFAQTRRRLEQVSILHQIDMVISSSADLRNILKFVLEHVLTQLNVHAASVLLLDPVTMTLKFAHGTGFRSTNLTGFSLRLGENQAGRAALERRPIFISNLKDERQAFSHPETLADEDFLAYACMPLIAKGEVIGILEVFNRERLTPDDDWMEFFNVLAGQTAIAIDNSVMFDDLQRSHLELSLAYDATIEGWSRALDLRDRETEGHTQRVTDLTIRLARRLGISDAEIVHLRRGGLLHDIGKMGVPDTILNKPGPLTEDELLIMRRHPQYAYDMLMPISYLRPALDIPYAHHEKWDGSGYPRGLRGYAIPVAARIFAVSDVFDALTSDRPYRKAWSQERTLAYLRDQSGRHFASEIVDAFLSIIGESSL